MKNHVAMQDIEGSSLEIAVAALGKSIARCTEKGETHKVVTFSP